VVAISLGIVTPTFNRRGLLQRYLKRIGRQTYRSWRLIVVHDGPSPAIEVLVKGFHESDPRIEYVQTESPAADSGVSPRLKGAAYFLSGSQIPDYIVFWDDDNAYTSDALERIARAIEEADRPDLLVVRVKYGPTTVPPADVAIRSLRVGQIDTACLVFRSSLALDAYASVQQHARMSRNDVLFFNDFLAYNYVNQLVPLRSIKRAEIEAICQHDGLRWGPYIRSALNIPPLRLARYMGLGR
jgi:glycosyltransferase involved in cell wall biosynthesis